MFRLFLPSTPPESARLRRIERKLDRILEHLGLPPEDPDEPHDEVRALAEAGRKIEAIRAHRRRHGSGLREAKQEVEVILARRPSPPA